MTWRVDICMHDWEKLIIVILAFGYFFFPSITNCLLSPSCYYLAWINKTCSIFAHLLDMSFQYTCVHTQDFLRCFIPVRRSLRSCIHGNIIACIPAAAGDCSSPGSPGGRCAGTLITPCAGSIPYGKTGEAADEVGRKAKGGRCAAAAAAARLRLICWAEENICAVRSKRSWSNPEIRGGSAGFSADPLVLCSRSPTSSSSSSLVLPRILLMPKESFGLAEDAFGDSGVVVSASGVGERRRSSIFLDPDTSRGLPGGGSAMWVILATLHKPRMCPGEEAQIPATFEESVRSGIQNPSRWS